MNFVINVYKENFLLKITFLHVGMYMYVHFQIVEMIINSNVAMQTK